MITLKDLETAIAECQGVRNPDAKTCIMLAAFYTIKNEMFGEEKQAGYSFEPAPEPIIELHSNSRFARLVNGRKQDEIMPVIDELIDTVQIIQPRLYDVFMEKLL